MKRGGAGFDFDTDILTEQKRNLAKMSALQEFDELEDQLNKKGQQEDGRSLKDMLKEKRELTEKALEGR